MNHTKRLSQIMSRLGDGMQEAEARHSYGGMFERMNAAQIKRDRAAARKVLFAICVLFGMALAAVALSHGYARALDAVAVPHLEGFE